MEQETTFEVRDKRSSAQQASQGSHPSQGTAPSTSSPHHQESKSGATQMQSASSSDAARPAVEITFTSFILSLAASGLIQLGGEADPATGKKSVNLTMARQTIDLLSLLQVKTKGNLTAEEDTHLSQALYALRMAFVELDKKR